MIDCKHLRNKVKSFISSNPNTYKDYILLIDEKTYSILSLQFHKEITIHCIRVDENGNTIKTCKKNQNYHICNYLTFCGMETEIIKPFFEFLKMNPIIVKKTDVFGNADIRWNKKQ